MSVVGIRELRQRASELIRRVEGGETITVTDRGRPVALLTPPPAGTAFDRLLAAGDVEPATGVLDDLPPPLALAPGAEPPADALRRLRADKR